MALLIDFAGRTRFTGGHATSEPPARVRIALSLATRSCRIHSGAPSITANIVSANASLMSGL